MALLSEKWVFQRNMFPWSWWPWWHTIAILRSFKVNVLQIFPFNRCSKRRHKEMMSRAPLKRVHRNMVYLLVSCINLRKVTNLFRLHLFSKEKFALNVTCNFNISYFLLHYYLSDIVYCCPLNNLCLACVSAWVSASPEPVLTQCQFYLYSTKS